jgi:hypothetical protein
VPLHLTYGKGGVLVAVKDLDGNPMTDPKYQPDRVRNHLQYLNLFSRYIGDSHGLHYWHNQQKYRNLMAYFWGDNPIYAPRMEQWFNLLKADYMVGYLPKQKTPFAYLDRTGFKPITATPEPWSSDTNESGSGADIVCIWNPSGARLAFMSEQKVVDLALPAPGPIYGVGLAFGRIGNGSVNVTGLTLGSGMAVYNDKGELINFLAYHHDVSQWGKLELGVNGALDRFYLVYSPSEFIPDDVAKAMPSYIDVMDAHGQVIQSYTRPPLPPNEKTPPSWGEFLYSHLQTPAFFYGTIVYKKIGALFGSTRMQHDLDVQFGKQRDENVEAGVDIIGLSLLLSVLTLVWTRRVFISWKRAWAWAGFVFAFGLPGFIAFRLGCDWPRLVPCPTCAKSRPIEATTCPHCGAHWPKPSVTGIEIFDRSPADVTTGVAN